MHTIRNDKCIAARDVALFLKCLLKTEQYKIIYLHINNTHHCNHLHANTLHNTTNNNNNNNNTNYKITQKILIIIIERFVILTKIVHIILIINYTKCWENKSRAIKTD